MSTASRVLCAIALAAVLLVPATSRADDDDDRVGDVAVGSVGHDGAAVSGTLRLRDGETRYWFEYGPAGGERAATPQVTVRKRDVGAVITVSRTLSGLAPATLHTVRLVAVGDGHPDEGDTTNFTTAAAPTAAPEQAPGDAPPAAGAPQPHAAPDLGVSVVAAAEQGAVRVRLPGSDEFVDLAAAASVPVGTVVDARHGTLALTTALPDGGVQHGSFKGARFQVRQSARDGFAALHLRGGLAACRPRKARTLAAVAARKPPKKPGRRLWGKDHGGRFRTHGRDSVTTVRGTEWSVADRCDGTLTRVTEGAVDVRVRRSGRVVRVAAGERFLARHRR